MLINAPDGYAEMLEPLPEGAEVRTAAQGQFDFVHLFVNSVAEMDKLALKAIKAVKSDGLLWISYPKKSSGVETDISRDHGCDIVFDSGMRGVAQISIDDTWSAVRLRPVDV